MYPMLTHAHSGIRWIVIGLLIYAIYNSFSKMNGKKVFGAGDRKINLFAMAATHLQIILGFVLYTKSPKVINGGDMSNSLIRFFTIEHMVYMLIAAVLITIGYAWSKRTSDEKKAKIAFWFYLIAFIIILIGIPWPFREELGGAWF